MFFLYFFFNIRILINLFIINRARESLKNSSKRNLSKSDSYHPFCEFGKNKIE